VLHKVTKRELHFQEEKTICIIKSEITNAFQEENKRTSRKKNTDLGKQETKEKKYTGASI